MPTPFFLVSSHTDSSGSALIVTRVSLSGPVRSPASLESLKTGHRYSQSLSTAGLLPISLKRIKTSACSLCAMPNGLPLSCSRVSVYPVTSVSQFDFVFEGTMEHVKRLSLSLSSTRCMPGDKRLRYDDLQDHDHYDVTSVARARLNRWRISRYVVHGTGGYATTGNNSLQMGLFSATGTDLRNNRRAENDDDDDGDYGRNDIIQRDRVVAAGSYPRVHRKKGTERCPDDDAGTAMLVHTKFRVSACMFPPGLVSLKLSDNIAVPRSACVRMTCLKVVRGGHWPHKRLALLPRGLRALRAGVGFTGPVGSLPAGLDALALGARFRDVPLGLPPHLTSLAFGNDFDSPVAGLLPETLRHLRFGSRFCKPLDGFLPGALITLRLGARFVFPIGDRAPLPLFLSEVSVHCQYPFFERLAQKNKGGLVVKRCCHHSPWDSASNDPVTSVIRSWSDRSVSSKHDDNIHTASVKQGARVQHQEDQKIRWVAVMGTSFLRKINHRLRIRVDRERTFAIGREAVVPIDILYLHLYA